VPFDSTSLSQDNTFFNPLIALSTLEKLWPDARSPWRIMTRCSHTLEKLWPDARSPWRILTLPSKIRDPCRKDDWREVHWLPRRRHQWWHSKSAGAQGYRLTYQLPLTPSPSPLSPSSHW
jgi:hypothetical protein